MSWEAIQERIFLEGQLERKLQFFFFLFVIIIVVSLLIPQKELAMVFLVVTVILMWLLAVQLWFFSNKVGSVDKKLATSGAAIPSFMNRTLRFVLCKILPLTAAFLLTSFLLVGISGVADSILPYKQKVMQVVEKGKEKIEKVVQADQPKANSFEKVESVIEKNSNTPTGVELKVEKDEPAQKGKVVNENATSTAGEAIIPAPKKVNVILAVDGSHQAPKQDGDGTKGTNVSSIQSTKTNVKKDPHFAPVESIEEKVSADTKRGNVKPIVKSVTVQTAHTKVSTVSKTDSVKKKINPDPNFKDINQVIKK